MVGRAGPNGHRPNSTDSNRSRNPWKSGHESPVRDAAAEPEQTDDKTGPSRPESKNLIRRDGSSEAFHLRRGGLSHRHGSCQKAQKLDATLMKDANSRRKRPKQIPPNRLCRIKRAATRSGEQHPIQQTAQLALRRTWIRLRERIRFRERETPAYQRYT